MVGTFQRIKRKLDSKGRITLTNFYNCEDDSLRLIFGNEKGIEFILGGFTKNLSKLNNMNFNEIYDFNSTDSRNRITIPQQLRESISNEKSEVIYFDFKNHFRLYSPQNAQKYLKSL